MTENQNPNSLNEKEDGKQQVCRELPNTNTTPSSSSPKPQSTEEQRTEDSGLLRQHERHILFHFFTLFSISFFIGVLIIHLSLWINANYLSSAAYNNDVTNTFHNQQQVMTSPPPNYHHDNNNNGDDVTRGEEKSDVTSSASGGELNLWFEPVRLAPHVIHDVIMEVMDSVIVIAAAWNSTTMMTSSVMM